MLIRAPIAAALVTLSVLWGYSWVFLKLGSLDAGPFSFAALRCSIGAVCLLLALPLTGRRFIPQRIPELLALGLVNTTGLVGCSQWAVTEGAANRTSILVFSMPFWTLLLAWLFLNERVRGLQWAAVACAAAGLTAVFQPWSGNGSLKSNVLAVTAGFLWAASAVMIKRIQRKAPMDLLQLTAWQMAFGATFLLVIAAFAGEAPIVWTDRFLLSLGFTAFVSTAFGWLLWVYVLDYLPAGVASMTILFIPVVAVSATSFHLNEPLAVGDIVGISFIIGGLILLTYKAVTEHRAATSEVAPE
ncbi:MAG: DMT family transporter [Gammaproteobacteria bacterium]|nr:DMT family transporter [Gammaproteobacteria bacterium]